MFKHRQAWIWRSVVTGWPDCTLRFNHVILDENHFAKNRMFVHFVEKLGLSPVEMPQTSAARIER
jgi:hypothetical protein